MADRVGVNHRGWRRAGRHYLLLLWKNFILAKRTPIRTLLEIILPVFFGFVLLGIRHIVKSEMHPNTTTYESFPIDKLPPFEGVSVSMLAYAPNTTFTTAVINRAAMDLGLYGKRSATKPRRVSIVALVRSTIVRKRRRTG